MKARYWQFDHETMIFSGRIVAIDTASRIVRLENGAVIGFSHAAEKTLTQAFACQKVMRFSVPLQTIEHIEEAGKFGGGLLTWPEIQR